MSSAVEIFENQNEKRLNLARRPSMYDAAYSNPSVALGLCASRRTVSEKQNSSSRVERCTRAAALQTRIKSNQGRTVAPT